MKLAALFFLSVCLIGTYSSVDLEKIRKAYQRVEGNETSIKDLYETLEPVKKQDRALLVAYKGAATTMMAKFAKGIKDKRTFFNEGKELLEFSVNAEPSNVEIRCIRLSVQENAPKILGYTKNIDEDRTYIIKNYNAMEDRGAKAFVKGFVSRSQSFTDAQKQLF
ncbi:hypothetical protein [Pseudozobellia thermophila]|uniref:Uncharacterized protein n=1 Tax=Pseudozobellia thermophila TaxID=192903 RepID=A0A1M6CKK3_9FLAO|nr:hypothetical protein [Pseudozobellia thermophila]SHI61248.1 hypothetical protein SAMN04488513_101788 [Pseudozobellia thermophila]